MLVSSGRVVGRSEIRAIERRGSVEISLAKVVRDLSRMSGAILRLPRIVGSNTGALLERSLFREEGVGAIPGELLQVFLGTVDAVLRFALVAGGIIIARD